MNPANSSKSSSTLRPRTRRLISVEDDIYATEGSDDAASRNGSRFASRNSSPTSTATPGLGARARLNVTSDPTSSFTTAATGQGSGSTRSAGKPLSGIWGNPWSAIQGIAANVMGNESPQADAGAARRRRPTTTRRTSVSASPLKKWGPTGAGSHVGVGPQEEREAMVRAMKRKDLMTANEHLIHDSAGRIKRRSSDERLSVSAPPGENDHTDALVYIHHVQPNDTLAGLSIRYNCDQPILRKSNRMWPNDSVQTKQTIVLPVDACGVKGRPVQGPEALPDEDLLLGDFGEGSSSTPKPSTSGLPNGWKVPRPKDDETNSVLSSNAESETPWKHDSWVLLSNDKKPTEIARLPRSALGFFPPARRKSIAYSDASTPRVSVDLPRSSTSTMSKAGSTSQPSRPRASSNLSSMSTATHNRPRNASGNSWGLQGPGGVGTLGRNIRSPGPAHDGIYVKKFAAYLPNVAPPPEQEYFTPWGPSLLDADAGTTSQYGGSGAITPMSGSGVDLQEIGGAIEGWVRKVGTSAQKLLSEPGTPGQGKRSAVPVIGTVGGDLGDLIELRDDAFEIGDDEGNRGRSRTDDLLTLTQQRSDSINQQYQSSRSDSTNQQYQSSRSDFNLVLTDRRRKLQEEKKY